MKLNPRVDVDKKLTTLWTNQCTVWFSYKTIVAFKDKKGKLHVCENVWSNTTGRHLNDIDGGDKENRIPRAKFIKMAEKI